MSALTCAKLKVFAERTSLNKWEVARKNLSSKSELTDMNSNLCIQQETDWGNPDQLIHTTGSQKGLSRRMKKKGPKAEGQTLTEFCELNLSRPADTTDVQQFVPPLSVIEMKRKTAYVNMSSTELVQTIYRWQELDSQALIVCQRLTTFDEEELRAESKFLKFPGLHMWSVGNFQELLYTEKVYVPREEKLRYEIYCRHHDDMLAEHFDLK